MANEYITRQAVQDTARAIHKDPILIMAVDAVAKAAPGVEVVRCRECKYGEMCSIREAMVCTVPDGFCWRGERKSDGK